MSVPVYSQTPGKVYKTLPLRDLSFEVHFLWPSVSGYVITCLYGNTPQGLRPSCFDLTHCLKEHLFYDVHCNHEGMSFIGASENQFGWRADGKNPVASLIS